jgi:phage baseplate assembly protein gpV
MVVNSRDRNIDSSRREDSRKGQIDRCEVINVRPHVAPYPDDKDFNTVDVQLIDRPMGADGKYVTIERCKINVMQSEHGLFQGHPWTPRIGDLVMVYWISEREAMVLCSIVSVQQEPICRSQADQNHQEWVHKLSPWRAPIQCADTKSFIIFPPPQHPDCFKWWPKTRDSIWIFDCLEGHNKASCCAAAPCNSLDDHLSSTCFKHFSDISPTTIDKQWRFKFLHHCGSYWYFDDDSVWRIEGKKNGNSLGYIHHYTDGKILIDSPVEVKITAPAIILDGDVEITGDNKIDGACAHGSCSCMGGGAGGTSGTCTGTGQANQAIAHGMTDNLGTACSPSSVTGTCRGGGSCSITGCDDTYFYALITQDETVDWSCTPPKDGWGDWAPCF